MRFIEQVLANQYMYYDLIRLCKIIDVQGDTILKDSFYNLFVFNPFKLKLI